MKLQDTLITTLKLRLLNIATEVDALKEESNSIKKEIVSRTIPKYADEQILQRMNEFGVKKNVRILNAFPSSQEWCYRC